MELYIYFSLIKKLNADIYADLCSQTLNKIHLRRHSIVLALHYFQGMA